VHNLLVPALLLTALLPGEARARSSWSYETLGAVWAAPLVLPDGRVLCGSEDGLFYGFATGGRLLFSYRASEGFSGWPALLDRKTVAVANRNGTLYLFDLDGALLDKIALGGAALGPAASAPGRLYLATAQGRLVAIDTRERKLLWSHPLEAPASSWPAVDPGGRLVYVGCSDGGVVAVDAAGTRRFRIATGRAPVRGGIAASKLGAVVSTAAGELVALDPNGKERWRRAAKRIDGGLVGLHDGGAVFGAENGEVTALDADGKPRWRFSGDSAIRSTPSVTDQTILVGSEGGTLYQLELRSGRPLALFFASGPIRGAATLAAGRVHFGSQDRRLYVVTLANRRAAAPTALRTALAAAPSAPLLFRSELSGPVAAGVGPGPGQTILCGTWGKQIYSLDARGGVRWTHNCGEDVDTLPAPTPNGGVVFGCGDGGFYGLKPDGELLFRYPVNKALASSPAVAGDGTIYFGAGDKRIYALTPAGKVVWKIRTGDDVDGGVRIGTDGVVYVGSDDAHLYAVGPTGHVGWYHRTRGAIRGRAALAKDGTVYIGSFDQTLYALAPNGLVRWSYQTDGQIASSPLCAPDGSIYVGSRDHHLYALDPQGKLRFRFETAGEVDSEPVLAADGSVVFGSDDGRLYALSPTDGSLRWWFAAGAELRGRLLARSDGSVVAGTMDGGVLAVAAPGSEAARGASAQAPLPRVAWRGRIGRGRTGPLLPAPGGGFAVAGADGVLRLYGADRWPTSQSTVGADRLSAAAPLGDDLYLSDARGNLARVGRSEGLRWRLRIERGGVTAPSVLAAEKEEQSLILLGSAAGRVWAVSPHGKVAWFWSGADAIPAPPAALAAPGDGATVVVAGGRTVTGLDRTGQQRFALRLDAGIAAGPIAIGRTLLVGDGAGALVALDAAGKRRWERDLGSGIASLAPALEGESVLARLEDGRLIELALADGEPLVEQLAPSPLTAVAPGASAHCVAGLDGTVSWVGRGSARAERALHLASTVVDLRASGERTVLLATAGGELVLLAEESK
jgi:outer membrane protein assembly factor BamB